MRKISGIGRVLPLLAFVLSLASCGLRTKDKEHFDIVSLQSLLEKDLGREVGVRPLIDDVEVLPEYPGGRKAFLRYLSEELVYPEYADMAIEGRVWVGFVVELDGSLSELKVLRGLDPDVDKEALRLVASMPRWRPARREGRAVRTRFALPIPFRRRP